MPWYLTNQSGTPGSPLAQSDTTSSTSQAIDTYGGEDTLGIKASIGVCDANGTPVTYTLTRRPTSDVASSGTWAVYPTSPTTKYDKVDEETSDGDDTYLTWGTTAGYIEFGFDAFDVPTGVRVDRVTVKAVAKDVTSGTNNLFGRVKTGGTAYNHGTPQYPTTSYAAYTWSWTTNPKTGGAWTAADVNGSGTNPLQAFGLYSTDANPQMCITQVWCEVVYTLEYSGTGQLAPYASEQSKSISVSVPVEVKVSDHASGGRVYVRLDVGAGGTYDQFSKTWYSPAESGESIASGTRQVVVRADNSHDGYIHWGNALSYADDYIFAATATYTPQSASQHSARHTDVLFDVAPPASAEDASNWSCSGGVVIVAAEMTDWDAKTVRLTHSALTEDATYTFTASDAITNDGDKTVQVTSAVPTPTKMTLADVVSRDSQHTDYVFNYEPDDAYLTASHITCPDNATFVSATKQADPRIVRVKHANVANGTYTVGVSASLASIFGETCASTSAGVTVSLQHDSTTVGLRSEGVYNGVLLGPGPAGEVRLAYVGPSNALDVGVYRSRDGTTYSKVNAPWPSSGLSGWSANTIYKPWDIITESGRTYQAVRVLGKHPDYQGKSNASEPTWPTTPGGLVEDIRSSTTYGEGYAGGVYYGVVWQENTSVTVASPVAEGSNYVYLICDRRPCYRDQPIEQGETGYYKASVDGGSTFTSPVAVIPAVDNDAIESLRLYKWRVGYLYGGRYPYKPFGAVSTLDQPSQSAYAGFHIAQLGHAYALTQDPEYAWFAARQLDYLIACQHGQTGDDRWLDATSAWVAGGGSGRAGQIAVDHMMRSVLYVYIGALHFARAGEATLAATIKERVDIWVQSFLASFAPAQLTVTWTPLGYGSQRTATAVAHGDWYDIETREFSFAEWTPNQHMSDAALLALLYTDPDSAFYGSQTALAHIEGIVALSHATIADTGEQVKALCSSSPSDHTYDDNVGGYFDSHLYAVFNNMLAYIIRDALPSEDWPPTLDEDTAAVYAWTALDVPEWTANESGITPGTLRRAPAGNRFKDGDQHFIYVASEVTTGVCGSTEPAWPTTQNATVTDGGVTWKARVTASAEPLGDTSYPGYFDGALHTGAGGLGLTGLVRRFRGLPWRRTDTALVDPDTLQIQASYVSGAYFGYSPNGFPLAAGTDKATYYTNGFSPDSNYLYTALFAVPAPPSSVTATLDGDHVDVTFTDNATNETGFNIYRKVDGGTASLYDTVGANAEQYVDTSLPSQWSTLQYGVSAYNDSGESTIVWSGEVFSSIGLKRVIGSEIFRSMTVKGSSAW